MFIIEDNVPIPPRLPRPMTGVTPTIETLAIGQSFVIPAESRAKLSAVYIVAKRLGVKCVTRRQADGSTRVWRVE